MRKIISLFIFMSFILNGYSKDFPGFYVTHKNDTVKCNIKLNVNLFNRDRVDPISCKYSVSIIEPNGIENNYFPQLIKGFHIENTAEGEMVFESIIIETKKPFFAQKIVEGDITLYRDYYRDYYNHITHFNFLIKKENQYYSIVPLGFRKKLSKYINDNEEIYRKVIKREYNFYQIPTVIEIYNQSKIKQPPTKK